MPPAADADDVAAEVGFGVATGLNLLGLVLVLVFFALTLSAAFGNAAGTFPVPPLACCSRSRSSSPAWIFSYRRWRITGAIGLRVLDVVEDEASEDPEPVRVGRPGVIGVIGSCGTRRVEMGVEGGEESWEDG
jgi:hypothetical protein